MSAEEWCVSCHADRDWRPDVTPEVARLEDDPDTDMGPEGDRGMRYRKWFERESKDPTDTGLLAWLRAGRVREYRQRGPRTNRGYQHRLATRQVGLYVLSPQEMHAILFANRWSPVTPEYLHEKTGHAPTPDNAPEDKAAQMRRTRPTLRRQLELAELPQDSEEWGIQRTRSMGSSSEATPCGWA
jgi:hypothetical protein